MKRFHAEMLSTLGWIVRQTGPIGALAHSMLGRGMSSPGTTAFTGIECAWRHLKRNPDVALNFVRDRLHDFRNGDCPRCKMAADAAFADDELARHSQGAWCGFFADVGTFDTWYSAKSSRVATSTCHAETIFAASAAKQACYVRNFLLWTRLSLDEPISLGIDNQSTVLHAASPARKWSPQRKHFDIDCHYISEAVELGVVAVHHVPGAAPNEATGSVGFPVDCLTKALPICVVASCYHDVQGPAFEELEELN